MASAAADRYFVFCYFDGGWDLLMGLDPRDPAVFSDDRVAETRIQTGYAQITVADTPTPAPVESAVPGLTLGPFAGRLVDHAHRLCVVRGMSMETLTHEVGRRRFLTGQAPAGLNAQGSSLATVLAAELGLAEVIPNLVVGTESYNAGYPVAANGIRVEGSASLLAALSPGEYALQPATSGRVDALLAEWALCDAVEASPFRSDALRLRDAKGALLASDLGSRFDFAAATPEMEALRAAYGFTAAELLSSGAQAALAATAIVEGISRCITVRIASGLDSHFADDWGSLHGPLLRGGFDAVAALAADLAAREYLDTGESWLDHTTIVGFSEFGRAALLNENGGRDHALTNACFLLGAGIRGGTVVGASSDVGMAPQAIDLATGALDPDGDTPRPEHVWEALLTTVGLEGSADLGVSPLAAVLA